MKQEFLDTTRQWLAALGTDRLTSDARLLRLNASDPPWQASGVRLVAGQAYSLFASGAVQWSPRDPTLYGGPRQHLCARVAPGGRVVNPTADSGSFVADVDGELELGVYVGVWKNAGGELATSEALYRRLTGGFDVLAIGWPSAAEGALEALSAGSAAAPAPPCFGIELARLRAPRPAPAQWDYLLETGTAAIFSDAVGSAGEPTIALDAHDDQGIVCTPVEVALTPQTRLTWRWRVSAMPSAVAEDRAQTHDYISIATEFDNGRDLTWIWSSTLAPETHFHCPVSAWTARETHFVVRSGSADLGRWCSEERHVHADVLAAMGSVDGPPARIVRVWLIAVSSFQHGTARAEFADIELHDGTRSWRVL